MNSVLYPVLATVAAYLIGSLSFAVIVSRVMGLNDPRTYGSKNPGATNVLRSGNKTAAVLTLLLDAAKGFVPVWLVVQFGDKVVDSSVRSRLDALRTALMTQGTSYVLQN